MTAKTLDAEIAVIGAGAAGLAAAQALRARERDCILLEASHRIGGRAYTEALAPDLPFDLGAHWIHSDQLNPFMTIAFEHGAELVEAAGDYMAADYFEQDQWLPKTAYTELSNYVAEQQAAYETKKEKIPPKSAIIDLKGKLVLCGKNKKAQHRTKETRLYKVGLFFF